MVFAIPEATLSELPSGLTAAAAAPFSGFPGRSPQPWEASSARQPGHTSWPLGLSRIIGEIESLLNEGTYSLPPSGLTTTPRGLFRTGKSMSPQGPAVRARHSTHFSCPPGFWTASRDTVLLTNEATYTEPPSGLTVTSSAPSSGASGTSPQPSEASFARQSSHLSWPPGLWAKKCETELLSWEAT